MQEIEANNRMGKTRDLFKKIRDTKGTFHAKMGSIKDTNGMDLIEAEDIKKRWQEYTELYKKDIHDPDNHHGVISHLALRARQPGMQSQMRYQGNTSWKDGHNKEQKWYGPNRSRRY